MVRRAAPCLLAALAALALAAGAAAEPPRAAAPEAVKAAFLYHFGRFVEWPPQALADRAALEVCVLGDPALARAAESLLAGKRLMDRPLTIRRPGQATAVDGCAILVLGAGLEPEMAAIRERLAGHGTLTVGDGPAFADAGAVISFVVVDNKMRFLINADAARAAGLKLSSQLLKLAVHVEGTP